ncbi:MAG: hypothetical protein O3C10_13310 [Chloroflexi bacterium]|nr:hypothetical protein [Chloroflexota bacterium]
MTPITVDPTAAAHVQDVRDGIRELYEQWLPHRDDLLAWADAEYAAWTERLDKTDRLDRLLRSVAGLSGCVFEPLRCPATGPMVCGGCKANEEGKR